jgi:protein-glucosylgalactosylhydroxylysine glucosidase
MRFIKAVTLLIVFALTAFPSGTLSPGFVLQATKFQPYTAGFLGNGHFSLVTTPLAITDAPSYMAWVYDHAKDDVPRIAIIPAWNTIDVKLGDTWLSSITPSEETIRSYTQQINMYNATLDTAYEWTAPAKTSVAISVQSFVSRANANLGVVKVTLSPRQDGPLELSFLLRDWPAPKRKPLEKLEKVEPDPPGSYPSVWYPGNMVVKDRSSQSTSRGGRAVMVSTAEGRQTTVAQVMEARWPSGLKSFTSKAEKNEDSVSINIRFQAESNQPYTFYKFVGIASSRQNTDPLKLATTAVDSMKGRSYDAAISEQLRVWHDLWNTDIEIEGNEELQKLVRSMMFYLLCSSAKDTDFSIPPMGLSSDGYYGHIFWDADTWMFPPLLVTHPDIAKSLVMFRHRTLDAAQHKAKDLGYRGAMYPWEADEIGNETTPQFAYQNALFEIHIIGDIALAQWQYYLATGDKQWLKEYGYPVIQQTAEFWVSRINWNEAKKYFEIQKVVSVNEGLIGIQNDAYTNAVAKRNLDIATQASGIVGLKPDPQWKKIADGMFVPYDQARSVHLEYENAPDSALGSVVPLLSYPLQLPMSPETKRNNISYAVKRIENKERGAMMGITLLPLHAAEVQNREWFDKLFPASYEGYFHPPFYALSETPSNRSTNFVTGAGGFLHQVIFGYTGLRLTEDGLVKKFEPMLPSSVKKLKLKNFKVRNKTFNYEVP